MLCKIAPNEALRRGAMVVFDRTFAITWALEGVAILVAMLGAANSLLALVLDRRRDLGLCSIWEQREDNFAA